MKRFKHILLPVLVIASGIVAFAASPALRKMVIPPAKPVAAAPAIAMPAYDAKADSLFAELAGLYNSTSKHNRFLMEGNIRLIDQADTSASLNTKFRYCQRDSLRYYQLGDQEMLTLPGLYLTIDHSIRKIMMSPNARPAGLVMPVFGKAAIDSLKKEGYYISKEQEGPYTVIRLMRDTHVSCREFRVAFDSAGVIRSTFMRNSDLDDPADLSLDKLVTINVTHWQAGAVPEHLLRADQFIRREGNGWAPAAPFKDYEIKYIY